LSKLRKRNKKKATKLKIIKPKIILSKSAGQGGSLKNINLYLN